MIWTDIFQFILLLILTILLLNTGAPSRPYDFEQRDYRQERLQKIWDHFYTYEVHPMHSRFYVKRTNKIDLSRQYSSSYLTQAEAEAWMKTPTGITRWEDVC